MNVSDDPLYLKVSEALDGFRKRYLDRIEREQQKQRKMEKACKLNTEIQSKRAQEIKLNTELNSALAELSKRGDDLQRICASFTSGLTISSRDQQRLDKAKNMYQIGKKLTGVRFDFNAPPNVVKGYIKSEVRRTLTSFELPINAEVSDGLWALIETSTSVADKENRTPNM